MTRPTKTSAPKARFQQALRNARTKLRLTQTGIAKSLRVSQRTLVRWDNGQRMPERQRLRALVALIASMDAAAGEEIAVAAGTSLERLGLAVTSQAAEAAGSTATTAIAFERIAADAVVCAAADALDASPRALRPAIVAALHRMRDAGLGVDAALAALEDGAMSPP